MLRARCRAGDSMHRPYGGLAWRECKGVSGVGALTCLPGRLGQKRCEDYLQEDETKHKRWFHRVLRWEKVVVLERYPPIF
jgi:hypothetical protein